MSGMNEQGRHPLRGIVRLTLMALLVASASCKRGDANAEPAGNAAFTLDLLGLDACPVRVVLLRLEARACAAASVGRLSARGSNTYDPRSVVRPLRTGRY